MNIIEEKIEQLKKTQDVGELITLRNNLAKVRDRAKQLLDDWDADPKTISSFIGSQPITPRNKEHLIVEVHQIKLAEYFSLVDNITKIEYYLSTHRR